MAVGDVTQGRRLPDDAEVFAPGDYKKSADGRWDLLAPRGHLGAISTRPGGWSVVEHEDGTITVSPSIRITSHAEGTPDVWHGFLERGMWREV